MRGHSTLHVEVIEVLRVARSRARSRPRTPSPASSWQLHGAAVTREPRAATAEESDARADSHRLVSPEHFHELLADVVAEHQLGIDARAMPRLARPQHRAVQDLVAHREAERRPSAAAASGASASGASALPDSVDACAASSRAHPACFRGLSGCESAASVSSALRSAAAASSAFSISASTVAGIHRLQPGTEQFERDFLFRSEPARGPLALDDAQVWRFLDEPIEAGVDALLRQACRCPTAPPPSSSTSTTTRTTIFFT